MSTGVTQRAWQLITNKTAQWLELSRKQGAESADLNLFMYSSARLFTQSLGCMVWWERQLYCWTIIYYMLVDQETREISHQREQKFVYLYSDVDLYLSEFRC